MELKKHSPHFRLDVYSKRLLADDTAIALTPKLFSMLRFFAENPGRLITKQELLDQIWPDTHVADGLVKDYVRKIRNVLNDDAEQPSFIETARGMGYRLIGDIPVSGGDSTAGSPTAARLTPTVAVLPFTDASDGMDQEHFATGIAEDIIAELARFRILTIIASESSFLHGAEPPDLGNLAHRLAAEYIVRGSVRRAGGRVRVNVQLIEPGSGRLVWAENYDRRTDDVFAVHDDIACAIASKLAGYMEETGRRRAARKRPQSLSAYEHLLLGNWHLKQGTEQGVAKAREMFQTAIDLEPTYARAHAEMAFSYMLEFWSDWTLSPDRAAASALALAQEATGLDHLDARAHLYLASAYHYADANFTAAGLAYDRAIQLNPNDYDAFCLRSWLLALSGQADEGIACAEQAIRLSPLTTEDCRVAQCFAAYGAKRYEYALEALLSIAEPTAHVKAFLAMCHAQLGQHDAAARAMSDFLAMTSGQFAGDPGGSRNGWRNYWATRYPFKDKANLQHMLEGLAKAGLPMGRSADRD